VLCLYEDEVVLLQDKLLQQQGLDKGLPGIAYELADMQVCDPGLCDYSRQTSSMQLGSMMTSLPASSCVPQAGCLAAGVDCTNTSAAV
jgi:hypothetical protein